MKKAVELVLCGFIKTGKKKWITENMILIDYEKSNVVIQEHPLV